VIHKATYNPPISQNFAVILIHSPAAIQANHTVW